jgi:hypothetical protein
MIRVLTVIALLGCASAVAAAERPKWRYFDDAPSPFLQFSRAAQGDVHRTTIACDGPPRTILIEQGLTAAEAARGPDTMVLRIGRLDAAPAHGTGPDAREDGPGRVVSAGFDVWSSQMRALGKAGRLSLTVRGVAFTRPPIPSGWLRSFMWQCRRDVPPLPGG